MKWPWKKETEKERVPILCCTCGLVKTRQTKLTEFGLTFELPKGQTTLLDFGLEMEEPEQKETTIQIGLHGKTKKYRSR